MADHGQLLTDDGWLEETHPGVSESSAPPATVQRPPRTSGRRPRWQWIVAIVLVVALLAGGALWWFLARRTTTTTAAAAATTTTTSVAASLNTITDSISASGTVTPAVQQAVSFAASGKVTAVKVAEGDTVKQGQVLGTIDTVNLKAALASSQATLASDQAKVSADKQSIVAASSAFSSSVSSYSSASSSSSSVAATATTTATSTPEPPTQNTPSQLAAQTQLSADEAAVVTAQSQVTAAQQALANATLTAPIAGIVTAVSVDVGDQVTGTTTSSSSSSGTKAATGSGSGAGSGTGSGSGSGSGSGTTTSSSSSGAFEIVGTSSWQASVTVDDSQIGLIKNGIQAQLVVGSSTNALFGRVTSVGLVSTSTGSTASYPVTVTITGAPTGLHDGASATVTLIYKQLADVLTVPTLAIHEENSQKVVYQSVNGKQVSIPVTTGETSGLLTQITAGLAEGDEVLVTTTTRVGGTGGAARTGARGTSTRTGGFGGYGGYGTGGAGGGFGGNAGGNGGGNVGGGGAGAPPAGG